MKSFFKNADSNTKLFVQIIDSGGRGHNSGLQQGLDKSYSYQARSQAYNRFCNKNKERERGGGGWGYGHDMVTG